MTITGFHALLFNPQADELRVFLSDVLGLPFVDAGASRLIFALPPAELAVQPTGGEARTEVYLMCDDVESTVVELSAKGVTCRPITTESWGRVTYLELPGGAQVGLYEPTHPRPLWPQASKMTS